jgi:hypothetical protein
VFGHGRFVSKSYEFFQPSFYITAVLSTSTSIYIIFKYGWSSNSALWSGSVALVSGYRVLINKKPLPFIPPCR